MFNQTKYDSISIILSSSSEQSAMVICPNEPQKIAILQSYATNLPPQLIELVRSQIDRLLPLRHPHLQPVIDVFSENDSLHIVQGLAGGKPAATLVPLNAEDCEKLLQELLTVIIYLHDLDITHGNISPQTIILDVKNKSTLTNFKTINDLVSTAKGEATRSIILDELSQIPVAKANIPQGKQFDLYSLGLTAIYLLTDREFRYLYDLDRQRWQWEKYTNCNSTLVTAVNQLLISQPITAREVLATLESSSRARASPDPPDFNSDRISSTFIELPNNINNPVYLQAGILGFLVGSIWIVLHNLVSWGSLETGILGMTIGGAIYWQYRSPFKMNQLLLMAGLVSILMILASPLRRQLPIFTNIEHPGFFDIVLFLISCGLFNFSVFVLAGVIYRFLSTLFNSDRE